MLELGSNLVRLGRRGHTLALFADLTDSGKVISSRSLLG